MFSKIVISLFRQYEKLLEISGLPLARELPSEENFNMETALSLIEECQDMIEDSEEYVFAHLVEMEDKLSNFTVLVQKYNAFNCKCADTMKMVNMHSKARDGLQNRLPQLVKDIELVALEFQDMIDMIFECPEEANVMDLTIIKKKRYFKLKEFLSKKQAEYIKFQPWFERLFTYLERKIDPSGSIPKINFNRRRTELEELEETVFIKKTFGDNAWTPKIRELLRDSLKDATEKRFNCQMCPQTIELTEEQMELKMIYTNIKLIAETITFFKTLRLPYVLVDLYTCQLLVHRQKQKLANLSSEKDFPLDDK